MNDLERLWNLPHIQELVTLQNEIDTSEDDWPKDIRDALLERWKKRRWSITLGGHTFQGTFDRLDYSQRYMEYLEHDEAFAALEIIVPLAEPFQFLNTPTEQASIDLKDARGWPVYLTLYGKEMHITAHPATFTSIEEKE
jgi:hypothetical protein